MSSSLKDANKDKSSRNDLHFARINPFHFPVKIYCFPPAKFLLAEPFLFVTLSRSRALPAGACQGFALAKGDRIPRLGRPKFCPGTRCG